MLLSTSRISSIQLTDMWIEVLCDIIIKYALQYTDIPNVGYIFTKNMFSFLFSICLFFIKFSNYTENSCSFRRNQ